MPPVVVAGLTVLLPAALVDAGAAVAPPTVVVGLTVLPPVVVVGSIVLPPMALAGAGIEACTGPSPVITGG